MQNLFVNDAGDKFPLVMVHGFLGSSIMWEPQIQDLKDIEVAFSTSLVAIETAFQNQSFADLGVCLEEESTLLQTISDKIDAQIARTRKEEVSPKNTTLYFNVLLESKDLVKGVMRLVEEYHNSSADA